MATIFETVSLDNIEEGDFFREANLALLDVQRQLVRHREKYGELSKKSTAELTLKIKLRIEEPDQDLYSIVTDISKKTPGRPKVVTVAMEEFDDEGKPALHVRSAGSDRKHPRQSKMFTNDGRSIDPSTGKAIEE